MKIAETLYSNLVRLRHAAMQRLRRALGAGQNDLALAYPRYLKGVRAIAYLRPAGLAYAAGYVWARVASPRRAEWELVQRQMRSCAPELAKPVGQGWDDYVWHAAANSLNTYLYSSMSRDWLGGAIEVRGLAHLRAAHERGAGVLVLTGHQHSLMLLGVALGLLEFPTHAILMDPKLTVPDFLEPYTERAIRDSSAHYNGGGYFFVDYNGAFVRPVFRALQAGRVVVSANDFPASLAPKRRQELPFLGRKISCPTGSVEIALQTGAAIVPAFVRRENGRLLVEFHPELHGDTESIMRAYGKLLEATVRADPGGWEGWKWGDVFDLPQGDTMTRAHNVLGDVYPTETITRMAEALGIRPGEKVLDIGGGHAPLPEATVVVEYNLTSGHDRDGQLVALDERYIEGDAQALPFPDQSFDFAYASHVFEHVCEPARACTEMMRVARRGFIETPRKMTELFVGYPSHRWLVDVDNGVLTFERRWYVESPFQNGFLAHMHNYDGAKDQALINFRNLSCVQFPWQKSFRFNVVERPGWRDEFDYDNPAHAGWSHFYFALNLLANGDRWESVHVHARTALEMQPQEGVFHALEGVVNMLKGAFDEARQSFERAQALQCRDEAVAANMAALRTDAEFCHLPLGRGTLRWKRTK